MKIRVVSLFFIALMACKEGPKEMKTESEAPAMAVKAVESKYPEALQKVFEAHGGLSMWKAKRVLSYEIPKPGKTEKHTIDLNSRDEKIEMPGISMGSEGDTIWLQDEGQAYKGDPVFYHNLMFYFYAMPFVLADEGINYSEAEALEFEGSTYPGIRISYNDGVGVSPKDEYYVHYDPETYQMEWLGYTVTFRSGEKSENIKWIRYHDLIEVDGLVLPKSLTWHDYEGRTIKEARDPMIFENVNLSMEAMEDGFFAKPTHAKIVNRKSE